MENAATGPSQVLIIRHGEKLGDSSSDQTGGPDLSQRGSARAAALPQLFAPSSPLYECELKFDDKAKFSGAYKEVCLTGAPPRFTTPDFLFATQKSKHSNRPVETITPVSAVLGIAYNDKHPDGDYAKVAEDILTNAKYGGKTVLICWHHGNIPNLATALGIADPPPWHGSVFDRVWVITYTNNVAALTDSPQMLLYGDTAS